jgi:enolase-phosphatase E1
VGGKLEPESYRKIAGAIAQAPGAILFLSDHAGELAAAAAAGFCVLRLDRARAPDSPPVRDGAVPVVSSFDWIDPEAPSGLRAA